MSTLNSILGSAASGLVTSQSQLRVVSDNIANVNTPGYTRKVADQQSVSSGAGGVEIGRITRAVDQFLVQAGLSAAAQSGSAGVVSDIMDRAQSLFGDPSTDSGFFNQLNAAFAAFSAASQEPASSVARNQALNAISGFLDQSASISQGLGQLSDEADSRIASSVGQANTLLTQIDDLNRSIVRDTVAGADVTGAQNSQDQLVNQLASLMKVSVSKRADGGIDIRGGDGGTVLLVGKAGPASLSFTQTGAAPGQITVTTPGATSRSMSPGDGVLQGLIDLRNTEIPAVASQLGEYVTRAVDELNRAHNALAAVPPPNTLTGRNTGLDLPTAVSGFTGKTTIGIVDAVGTMQSRIDIDFDAGTITADGGAPAGFTPASFLATLNTALGGNGTASFSNGALSIQAAPGDGVALADDATTPSSKAGKGFSQYFGLNDLITSTGFPYPATGLAGGDPNGFSVGGVVTLRLTDAAGSVLKDAAVTVPAGGTVDDLVAALNDPNSGVGLYGAFSLDSQGRISFAPSVTGAQLSVLSDTSQRGAGGPTVSQLFGIDPSLRAGRAGSFSIRSDIASNSMNLSMAMLDPTVTAGQSALSKGDARGALMLAAVGDVATNFDPAGSVGAIQATLSQYGAQFSGAVAARASTAQARQQNAEAVASEAQSRRSSVEGVNLDEELIKLTTYQQSYNASARLISAISQMYDTLINMT